jgi:hypothetical protein
VNCANLARVLDLVEIDARFDRDAAASHLARCATCAARYPEIAWLVVSNARPRSCAPRSGVTQLLAAALLLGATVRLAHTPLMTPPRTESAVAHAADHSVESPAPRIPRGPGVRYLPSHASTVVYTTRRPVGNRDNRGIESTVIRGGDRTAGTIELLR